MPAPIDPPKELVVSGLYNYVRNPMYVGMFLVILGHFLWFGYWNMLIYAMVVMLNTGIDCAFSLPQRTPRARS